MIKRFTHLGLAVHDLDAATAAWCDQFGLVIRDRLDTIVEGFRTVMLTAPDDPDGFAIELIAPVDPTDTSNQVVRFLARHGEGVFHLAGLVGDISQAAATMADAGAHVVVVPPGVLGEVLTRVVDPSADRLVVAPRSTHGVLVELLQPHDRAT